jgi:hypothetical protein
MPTGSGKTTGAIWGIKEVIEANPSQRICFLTPYTASVETVYGGLVSYLGVAAVGRYYSGLQVDKDTELAKPVVVLTHQFLPSNKGRLDDRTLFVVDEALYATCEVSLTLEDITKAMSWSTTNNVMTSEFNALFRLTTEMYQGLNNSGKSYHALPRNRSFRWAEIISEELDLRQHVQTVSDYGLMNKVQHFCAALPKRQAFLSKGHKSKNSYNPTFSAAVLGIPNLSKTVVLSATGGMIYDLAGPFKQSRITQSNWSSPSYEKLNLVQLSAPKLYGNYKTWGRGENRQQVVAYINWLLSIIPEHKVYLTMPKQVLEGCLSERFDLPASKDTTYPLTHHTEDGKTVYLSHHALSIGSNQFKDCDAVAYLWDNHIPSSVSIQRYHTLGNEEVSPKAVESLNNKGRLSDCYKPLSHAQYIENMMQHIGRGKVRNIDSDGRAGQMTGYILTDTPKRFVSLIAQYKNCTTLELPYDGIEVSQPSGIVDRVILYLKDIDRDVPLKEVEKALGCRFSHKKKELQNSFDLIAIGFRFEAGSKGRSKSGYFRKL